MIAVGIDPGQNGAVAVVSDTGLLHVASLPGLDKKIQAATEPDLVACVRTALETAQSGGPYVVGLEYVRAGRGQGVTSMFSFGWNYGALRATLAVLVGDWQDVRPVEWQRGVSAPTRKVCGGKPQHKEALYQLACSLYPNASLYKKQADAVLIATYVHHAFR